MCFTSMNEEYIRLFLCIVWQVALFRPRDITLFLIGWQTTGVYLRVRYRNQLTVNLTKMKSMLFGTTNMLKHCTKADIYLGGVQIQYVKHYNYLGMRLEDTLPFKVHATETMRRVSHKLYLLSRIRKYITVCQSLAISKSKVVPYFDYGDFFLMGTSQKTTVLI